MRRISAMAMVALFGTATVLWACDKDGKIIVAGAKTSSCCSAKLKAATAGVMKTMPSMAYRVGDTDTPCIKTATAKAGKDGKVQFLVAGKAYDVETEATIALAELLEKEIVDLQAVQLSVGGKSYGCPMSAKAALKDGEKMKYRLAGFDFATKEEAEKAQKIINCKLKGCDSDCIKDCVKNFPAMKLTADGKKAGCNPNCKMGKGKAATAAAKGMPCHQGKDAKAATVAAKGMPCHQGKDAKAATVAAKDGSPCPHALGAGAALAGAKKGGCNKGKATTASAKGDKPCCAKGNKAKAAKAATVAAKGDKPCCAKGNKAAAAKAVAVAAKGDKPCCAKGNKAKAATAAAGGSPCGKSKAAKAATVASGGSPCSKASKAATVAGESKGGCCKKAQQRLATAQDQIKLIVETAATLALSS